jgi:hypothetical protein
LCINEMPFKSGRFQDEIFYIKVEKSIAVKIRQPLWRQVCVVLFAV